VAFTKPSGLKQQARVDFLDLDELLAFELDYIHFLGLQRDIGVSAI
jgi:hypothetical protein